MRARVLAAAFVVAGCATPASELDTDPNNLQIEIGRYSALLGQVSEYTGVSYDHAAGPADVEAAEGLMLQLREAVADYNAVRAALCASRSGATTYARIRAESCGRAFRPAWSGGPVTLETVARRSGAAGGPIIGLWGEVCGEARRLEKDPDVMVCPME